MSSKMGRGNPTADADELGETSLEETGQQLRISYNQLALLGVIIYLLEFAFIIPFYREPPGADTASSDLLAFYAANRTDILIYVAGVSAAILGRIAFTAGLRDVLRQVPDARALMDVAFGLVVVAVALESIEMALAGVAASVGTFGSEPPVDVAAALHNASLTLGIPLVITHGLFAAVASLAMLRSRVLPRWIGWAGLVGGIAFTMSFSHVISPNFVGEIVQVIGWLLIVVWMLATGIVLFRRARSQRRQTTSRPVLVE